MNLPKQNSAQDTIFLPQNIKCLRKKLSLSQEELAKLIGLNRGNIASYENGTAEPKICNLLKIANLFRISILDLTKRDLSNTANLSQAANTYQALSDNDREIIEHYAKRIEELEEFVSSIQTCMEYKRRNIGELPKDVQMAVHNFDQLFDATQNLMLNHKALLEFVKCRIPR